MKKKELRCKNCGQLESEHLKKGGGEYWWIPERHEDGACYPGRQTNLKFEPFLGSGKLHPKICFRCGGNYHNDDDCATI